MRQVRVVDEPSGWYPIRPVPPKEERARPPQREDVDVDELRDALSAIPNHERETWIEVGMALHSTELEEARDLWDDWSQGQDYADYSCTAQEHAWGSFREGGTTVGSVFWRARKEGWAPARATAQEDFAQFVGEERESGPPDALESQDEEDLSSREREMRRLNRRYAFVRKGQGVVADFRTVEHPVEFVSTRAFLGAHAHPRLPSGRMRADGTDVLESAGKIWLERYPARRTFHHVDFYPPGCPDPVPPQTLNLWQGWRFAAPAKARPPKLYLQHVREVICAGDEDAYRTVIGWAAHLVQRPWIKPGTAIVLRSIEGTGKGIFADALLELCGVHGAHVTHPKQLTGAFNSHMAGKLLIFADEVTWGGRRQEEGVLKGMITEKTMMLEPKGIDAFPAKSFCRIIISSNNEWVVPASRSARRFIVLDVSEERVGQLDEWHVPILDELAGGGYEGLMRFLLDVDLSQYPDPRIALVTDALRDQKIESLDAIDQWLLGALSEGRLSEYSDGWPRGPVTRTETYESYLSGTRQTGTPRRSVENLVTARLKKVFGKELELTKKTVGEGDERGQRRVMIFPPLSRSRELFERYLRSDLAWDDDVPVLA